MSDIEVFKKQKRDNASPYITSDIDKYKDETINWMGVYFAYAYSNAKGRTLNILKTIFTLGLSSDDVGHSWAIFDTNHAKYVAMFGGSGLSSSSSSSSCGDGCLVVRRFYSQRDCHDFGLSDTNGRKAGDDVFEENFYRPRRTVYLREVVPWFRSFDVDYGLLTHNCQDFTRYLRSRFRYL